LQYRDLHQGGHELLHLPTNKIIIMRKEMEVRYCPTNKMIADYMTKPLIGFKFIKFRKTIMDNG
jgi:hypothetical protein